MRPNGPGWYWFLPDEHCPTPTGLLRIDQPVVVLVGPDKYTRDGPPANLVVRFPQGTLGCDAMSGEWERIPVPKFMQAIARERWSNKAGY